jgi:hypothetical protein
VGSDGSLQDVGGIQAANTGTFDAEGQFYCSVDGKAWGRVDLKPESANYSSVVEEGTSDSSGLPQGFVIADWAYTPFAPDYLYSVGIARGVVYVVRWSMSTHAWEVAYRGTHNFGLRRGGFGTVVATSDGVLYAVHQGSGAVLWIPLDTPELMTRSSLGLGRNTHGCRCALQPDVVS